MATRAEVVHANTANREKQRASANDDTGEVAQIQLPRLLKVWIPCRIDVFLLSNDGNFNSNAKRPKRNGI